MKKVPTVFCMVGIGVVMFAGGYVLGFSKGQFQSALEEAKVARASLKRPDITVEPQLREYLKGRIYYLIGTKFPDDPGYLSREQWDVGTVDLGILEKPFYAKDPAFVPRTYDEAVAEP